MTTSTVTTLPDGTIQEVRTTPGAAPIVFLNGIIQHQSDYRVVGNKVYFDNHPWEKWFAWRPVKDIHGQWHWGKTIYRKVGNTYVDHDNWTWYHYGTIFDVLEETK